MKRCVGGACSTPTSGTKHPKFVAAQKIEFEPLTGIASVQQEVPECNLLNMSTKPGSLRRRDHSEKSMILAICTSGEIERVRVAHSISAKHQSPESWVHDHIPVGVFDLA